MQGACNPQQRRLALPDNRLLSRGATSELYGRVTRVTKPSRLSLELPYGGGEPELGPSAGPESLRSHQRAMPANRFPGKPGAFCNKERAVA